MSQVSDVSLANQGFSAFRTELNNIFGYNIYILRQKKIKNNNKLS